MGYFCQYLSIRYHGPSRDKSAPRGGGGRFDQMRINGFTRRDQVYVVYTGCLTPEADPTGDRRIGPMRVWPCGTPSASTPSAPLPPFRRSACQRLSWLLLQLGELVSTAEPLIKQVPLPRQREVQSDGNTQLVPIAFCCCLTSSKASQPPTTWDNLFVPPRVVFGPPGGSKAGDRSGCGPNTW
jgi:hypothetical protein